MAAVLGTEMARDRAEAVQLLSYVSFAEKTERQFDLFGRQVSLYPARDALSQVAVERQHF
jgi:hypothetical protein